MPVELETRPARPRPIWRSIERGLRCRCPACGGAPMFRSFLKVTPVCSSCGEELHHERADDFPPYITITIVAKIIVGGVLMVEQWGEWPLWLHMAIWPALTVILALVLMQPVKGAVVAYQWAQRMHGFEDTQGTDLAANAEKVLQPRTLDLDLPQPGTRPSLLPRPGPGA